MVHSTENTQPPNEIPQRFSSVGVKTPTKLRSASRPVSGISQLASPHIAPDGKNLSSPADRIFAMSPTNRSQKEASRRSGRPKSKPLPHPDPASIGADLIHQRKAQWSEQKESILLGPYDYMIGNPGKDIRSQLISAFDAWLQVPKSSLDIITEVVGMLHTASLLVDDVEDSSNLRRGVPVAHAIYGTAQTINSANYVYFLALKEIGKLNNPRAIAVYAEEMVNLHRGQGMDLWWRDSLTCPSEDDYLEMVSNKTGGLFRLAVKLMQTESSNPAFALTSSPTSGSSTPSDPSPTRQQDRTQDKSNPLVPLVNTIGLLYQVLDDYQNLASTTYTANKGLAEDLTEGKFSFLIAHAVRSDPSDQTLPSILQQRTKDDDVKRFAVRFIENSGSFDYTRQVLRVLDERAMQLVDEVDAWDTKTAQSSSTKHGPDDAQPPGNGVRRILEKLRVPEPAAHANGNGDTNGNGSGNGEAASDPSA